MSDDDLWNLRLQGLPENEKFRILFILKRDGMLALKNWAKTTKICYRRATLSRTIKRGRYRTAYIKSYLAFKRLCSITKELDN